MTDDCIPHEDWSREHLIDTLKRTESLSKQLESATLTYQKEFEDLKERLALQKEVNEQLNTEVERWKSKPISDVLAGFIRATVREMDLDTKIDAAIDRSDIDADNIYNLDDKVDERVRDVITNTDCSDISGLEEKIKDIIRQTTLEISAELIP